MALLQIAEPGQSTAPHARRLAAGIDLGTTNSLVASVLGGRAEVLVDAAGEALLPSVVRYTAAGVEVGQAARDAAASDPLNTIASAKRLIGRAADEIPSLGGRLPFVLVPDAGRVPRLQTVAGPVTAVEVSAEILRSLAARARETLGGDPVGVVITVPAYFDDAQRQATKDAARLAGLQVLRLLNEPTAAAVAYGLDRVAEGVHAIYDLGGGTFDISILRLHRGVFEVLATGGDSALGGDDFDHVVADWLLARSGVAADAGPGIMRQLLAMAREVKERLTVEPVVRIEVPLPDGGNWQGELARDDFDALIEPLVRRTVSACRRAVRDAGVDPGEIRDVVMVGGSTRVPKVRAMVAGYFGREPLVDIDPDRVVAIGAALQADVLVGNRPDDATLLLDVNPLSLGIETMGGLSEKIIPRNTTIPVARAQQFTTFKDGQTAMAIHVVQGERELTAECRSLARFELRGIPPMVAGAARIRVTFAIDADGLLQVEAREETSGVSASVDVKPSYGLSDDEVTQMLRASIDHAGEDLALRRRVEGRVEAARVMEALAAALASDGDELLSPNERDAIRAEMAKLADLAAATEDPAVLAAAVRALEKHCEFYVERRMNRGIHEAMAGRRVDSFVDGEG
jgi:molecular chaperone HscA